MGAGADAPAVAAEAQQPPHEEMEEEDLPLYREGLKLFEEIRPFILAPAAQAEYVPCRQFSENPWRLGDLHGGIRVVSRSLRTGKPTKHRRRRKWRRCRQRQRRKVRSLLLLSAAMSTVSLHSDVLDPPVAPAQPKLLSSVPKSSRSAAHPWSTSLAGEAEAGRAEEKAAEAIYMDIAPAASTSTPEATPSSSSSSTGAGAKGPEEEPAVARPVLPFGGAAALVNQAKKLRTVPGSR